MNEKIRTLLNENDKFAKHNNIRVIKVEKGYAETEMIINENHINAAGVVQGGAIFTLADLAFGAASNSYGVLNLSLSSTISFIRPAKSGRLKAIAKEITKTKKISVYQIEVIDDNGNLVASMQGLAYSKDKTIP